MSNASSIFRSLIIYGLCLPLAVFLGYLLATPVDLVTFIIIAVILLVLAAPLFLRWHHPWLIASWNMSAVIFFLPGRPQIWLPMTAISFMIATLQFALNRKLRFIYVPSIARPLFFLAVVTLVTSSLTGGIGLRAFGSQVNGGRNYFLLLGAILGFFAISSRQIPLQRASLYVVLFFAGAISLLIGSVAGRLGPSFNFLFLVFPVDNISSLVVDVAGPMEGSIGRSYTLSFMAVGVFTTMLAHYGLKGTLDLTKPWRSIVLFGATFVGMLGGFRSMFVIFLLTLMFLAYFEGLLRARNLPGLLLGGILAAALVAGFADRLPLSVQRTLAFLPINVNPIAKLDAQGSSQWRLEMWRRLLPEIPQYLLLGKGYAINAGDLEMAKLQELRTGTSTLGSELAGDYHNGPLSVIIPFGIFGVLGFLWFLTAAVRVVYRNYRYGVPELHRANTFLLAYLVARIVFFMTVFGSYYSDMVIFTGLVGLSVSLNGGVAQPATAPQPQFVFDRARLQPGLRRPIGI